jgi:phage terminase large subunit GpA-like protein
MRLDPYQRDIADSLSDPEIERVTLVKATRIGFTQLIVAAIGSYVSNDPAQVLVVLPTESDARDFSVSDLEPTFAATPVLRMALKVDVGETDRNTILSRRFPGGSLKIIAARSPRNLRRHTARLLFIDEADACETGLEGNPITLAEKRTDTFPDRKIVIGSTPIFEDTSNVIKSYAQSDQRVYEVPCPECGEFTEIRWEHIKWDEGKPETAMFGCPHCGVMIDENRKFAMVSAGRWRATQPDVKGHAGFRLNSLVSVLANVSWAKLAAQWLQAKDNPADLQVFVNTVLAEPWKESAPEIDDHLLASRVKPFGIEEIPVEVLIISAGLDVQDDRIEITLLGWNRKGEIFILAHFVFWGSPDENSLWIEVDDFLKSRWIHPLGGQIGIDAAIVDSGDGDWTQKVYDFCFPRASRHIMAGKGVGGSRPVIEASRGKVKGGGRLWVMGVDVIKTQLFDRLQRNQMINFSKDLPAVFFEQLCAERRITRYYKGRPIRRFEPISGRRNEALDCVTMAIAARAAIKPNLDQREANLRNKPEKKQPLWAQLAR